MPLTNHEKEQVQIIDSQVKLLEDKNASDDVILKTLIDFVADTKCIVESCDGDELAIILRKHPGFAYFLSLVSLAMTA